MDPPFPLPMIYSTLTITCSIIDPGKQTTTPVLSLGVLTAKCPLKTEVYFTWFVLSRLAGTCVADDA